LTHTIFHTLSKTIFQPPPFTHTIFHTPSLTHHLSHTTLSHTIFHHTIFVTHHLSPHHLSRRQLCHTPSFLHLFLCLSFLPRPRNNISYSLLEEVDLWGYPVLLFFNLQHFVGRIPSLCPTSISRARTGRCLFVLQATKSTRQRAQNHGSNAATHYLHLHPFGILWPLYAL